MKISKLDFGLIFFVLMIMVQTDALAKRYVVDSTSQSTNWDRAEWSNYPSVPPDCAPSTPVTAMRMAKAGDTVYFKGGKGGNYNLKPNPNYLIPALNPANNGKAERPIQFVNFPNEQPHLRNHLSYPETGYFYPLIGANKKEWISWIGFDLSAADISQSVIFYQARNSILENCTLEGKSGPAKERGLTNYAGISIGKSEYITIRNCVVTEFHGTDGVNASGVKLYSGHNITIENCSFIENDYAIHDKNDGRYNVYKRNFIRSNAKGIELGAMAGGPPSEDIEFSNNIILLTGASGIGINIISSLPKSVNAVHGFRCYNNVINPKGSIGINFNSAFYQQYYNNIIINSSVAMRHVGDKGNIDYSDYNNYFNGQDFIMRDYHTDKVGYKTLKIWQKSGELSGGGNPDIHSFYANPMFLNSSGNHPLDYRLKAESPCRGTGKRGINIGAFPYDSVDKSSYVGSYLAKPATPTGLRILE